MAEKKEMKSTEVTSSKNEKHSEGKKKTNVLIIVLVVILALCALVGAVVMGLGYYAVNKVQDKAEILNEEFNDKADEFESIQEEMSEISRQVSAGEISQEEASKKIMELQKRALEIQQEN